MSGGSKTLYYRLKSIALDGSIGYSVIRVVELTPVAIIGPKSLVYNVPNPFAGQTSITYTLPEEGMVELVLYNSVGQQIDLVHSAMETAGEHTIMFNGSKLISGGYYCRLSLNNEVVASSQMTISR